MPDTARIAYEAYARSTGGKSLVSGDALPAWDDLPQAIRWAWDAAAQAVIRAIAEQQD